MNRFWAIASVLTVAAILVATADARVQAPSGDTCVYSGSGTQYTVNVTSGAGVEQHGVAFGAPGATITSISISGKNGNFSTAKLAPSTTGAWTSDEALTGTLAATVTLRGTVTGPFIIVPSSATQVFYDPVTCTVSTGGQKTVSFTVAPGATYDAAAGAWHLVVTVPVAGTISAVQPLPKPTPTQTAKSLVQAKKVGSKSRGKVTLTLRATPDGQAMLAAKKSISVQLRVAFDAKDGRFGHKTVTLKLHK